MILNHKWPTVTEWSHNAEFPMHLFVVDNSLPISSQHFTDSRIFSVVETHKKSFRILINREPLVMEMVDK